MDQVCKFENLIGNFFGSKYAVAVDCATHAIELCLRLESPRYVSCPARTYISVPMTFIKLGIPWEFEENIWEDYYYIKNTNIIDAAVTWKEGSYVIGYKMCLSFQYKKHLSLGRGGMILLDDRKDYEKLKKMSYDGRVNGIPWAEQEIDTLGYHYYMTPETAEQGIEKFHQVKDSVPKKWSHNDYPDLKKFPIFNKE